jgi:hypothetical protein
MVTENRRFVRRNIDLTVQIEMVDGSTVSCDLLDLSQGGVRLKASRPENLPEQFTLKLSNNLNRWARIVWRSAEEIGVEFLPAPQASTEDPARRSVMIVCPRVGKLISTGIQLTVADDFKKISNAERFTRCQYCNGVHGWTPSDAFLESASGS